MHDAAPDEDAELMRNLAFKLRALRSASGLSMQKLADKAGFNSREVVYNIERPDTRNKLRPVNLGVLIRLARALDVTPTDLVPELARAETAELAAARQKLACIAEIAGGSPTTQENANA